MLSVLLGLFSVGLKSVAMAATTGVAKLTTPIISTAASIGANALHVVSAVPLGAASAISAVAAGKGGGK